MKRPDFTRGFIPERTQQERLRVPSRVSGCHVITCGEQLPCDPLSSSSSYFRGQAALDWPRWLQSTLWGKSPCLLQLPAAINSGGPWGSLIPLSRLTGIQK